MDFSAPFVASTESPGWPAISRATDCSINSPRVLLISNTTWANRFVATDSGNVARNGEDRIAHRHSTGPSVTYDSCNPPPTNLAPSIFHRISDTPRVRGLLKKNDWPRYTEEEPEMYENEELDKLFAACDAEERLRYEFGSILSGGALPLSPACQRANGGRCLTWRWLRVSKQSSCTGAVASAVSPAGLRSLLGRSRPVQPGRRHFPALPARLCSPGDACVADHLQLARGQQAARSVRSTGASRIATLERHHAVRIRPLSARRSVSFLRWVCDDGARAPDSCASEEIASRVRPMALGSLGRTHQPMPHGRNQPDVFRWRTRRVDAPRLSIRTRGMRSAHPLVALRGLFAGRRA